LGNFFAKFVFISKRLDNSIVNRYWHCKPCKAILCQLQESFHRKKCSSWR
jgi:hypothetical protein